MCITKGSVTHSRVQATLITARITLQHQEGCKSHLVHLLIKQLYVFT
uniref:Uncharacterized protein n=1 Tax=Anguilla anguilla TaxID=7936 RepID=A0A0E9PAC5_ANGAN